MSTLLDPRFKKVGFGNASGCSQAVQRLTSEVASIIASNNTTESTTTKADEPFGLWTLIDQSVAASQSRPSTSDSLIVLRMYLDQPNFARKEEPLKWWVANEKSFPSLASHAKKYLAILATSVYSEAFYQGWRNNLPQRNRIKSKNVDMLHFLNKV